MPQAKVAITIDEKTLSQIDRLVREGKYKSRSSAIQSALDEKMKRWRRRRLIEEASKLDPGEERAYAEEALHAEAELCEEY